MQGQDAKEDGLKSRRRPPVYLLLVVCLALIAVGTSLSACSEDSEAIAVAYGPFESTALVWVAEDRGFFRDNGLAPTFIRYDTGVAALEAAASGEADVGVGAGEFPLVNSVLKEREVRAIASIARSELIGVVARKDRGIEEIADLRGKRVGTTVGTIAQFFLGRLLEIHGVSIRDVTLVDVRDPQEWVTAVVEGDVDAIATAEPYATLAEQGLGGNAVVWSAHSGQPLYALAVTRDEWLQSQPETARRFLRSLARAEEYAAAHPVQAQEIVRTGLDLDAAVMEAVWARNQFSLALDQSLIAAMEDETRWLISNGLTDATSIPDFRVYLREESLSAVRPEAVNLLPATSP